MNFVAKDSPVFYDLSEVPKSDFRFECGTVRLDSLKELKSSMAITLYGIKDNH